MSFLVEDLIESVKDRSFAPISQTTFQDADILRILNEELTLGLVSDILNAREDFFLATLSRSIVANKDHYLLPPRAIGNAIKALFFVDSNDNRRLLPRRDIDRSDEFSQSGGGDAEIFYFESDQVVLQPKPANSSGSLLFSYPRKPNTLVLTTSCAKITGVSSALGTTTLTVDTDLTADLSVGDDIDVLRGTNPYTLWSEAIAITAITSTTIAVATTDVSDVDSSVEPASGDYICPTGFANIPMIPEEFHPVLAQMGACRLLGALGDLSKWQAAKAELEQMRKGALKLVSNRAQSSPDMASGRSPLLRAFRGY